MKPTEDQLKIAEAMAQKKKLQWFNPRRKNGKMRTLMAIFLCTPLTSCYCL